MNACEPSVFLWLRLRLLRGAAAGAWRSPRHAATAALLAALLWAGLYAGVHVSFQFLQGLFSELFMAALTVVFAAFFLVMFGLLAFSNALVNYASLFRSWDVAFFRASPVASARLFWHKVADSAGYSLWTLLLLGVPIVFAFGRAVGAEAPYYLFALGAMATFTLLTVPLGAALALLFARFVLPTRRRMLALGLSAALLLVFLGAGEWMRRQADSEHPLASIAFWLEGPMARVSMARNPFLPSAWVSDCLVAAAAGNWGEAGFALALLAASALFFASAAWMLADVFYGTAFFVAQGENRQRRRRSGGFYGTAERLLPVGSAFKRLLLVKDLKVFLRSPAQWSQALLFCGVLLAYFVSIGRVAGGQGWALLGEMWAFLNVAAAALAVCTLTVRFAYPMMSLEGRAWWVLCSLPEERGAIVEAKFLGVALASLLAGAAMVLASGLSLGVGRSALALHLVAVAVLAAGLSAISVGLGTAFLSLGETHPAKIASGVGGTVNMVASVAFCAAVLLFLVLPFHLAGAARGGAVNLRPPLAQLWHYREYFGSGVVALTAALTVGMGRLAVRTLEALEA